MELEEQLELIHNLVDEIEPGLRKQLGNIAIKYDTGVCMSVCTSLGTTLLGLALMQVEDSKKELVLSMMLRIAHEKAKEGTAAIDAEYAINKAKEQLQ